MNRIDELENSAIDAMNELRLTDAAELWETLYSCEPEPRFRGNKGFCLLLLSRPEEALAAVTPVLPQSKSPCAATAAVCSLARLGDMEQGAAWFEQVLEWEEVVDLDDSWEDNLPRLLVAAGCLGMHSLILDLYDDMREPNASAVMSAAIAHFNLRNFDEAASIWDSLDDDFTKPLADGARLLAKGDIPAYEMEYEMDATMTFMTALEEGSDEVLDKLQSGLIRTQLLGALFGDRRPLEEKIAMAQGLLQGERQWSEKLVRKLLRTVSVPEPVKYLGLSWLLEQGLITPKTPVQWVDGTGIRQVTPQDLGCLSEASLRALADILEADFEVQDWESVRKLLESAHNWMRWDYTIGLSLIGVLLWQDETEAADDVMRTLSERWEGSYGFHREALELAEDEGLPGWIDYHEEALKDFDEEYAAHYDEYVEARDSAGQPAFDDDVLSELADELWQLASDWGKEQFWEHVSRHTIGPRRTLRSCLAVLPREGLDAVAYAHGWDCFHLNKNELVKWLVEEVPGGRLNRVCSRLSKGAQALLHQVRADGGRAGLDSLARQFGDPEAEECWWDLDIRPNDCGPFGELLSLGLLAIAGRPDAEGLEAVLPAEVEACLRR